MQPLIDNARLFGHRPERFARLAEGQSAQARPGEFFELRTAGNVVPPHATATPAAEKATIEYAVQVLSVRHVVVCGHSRCGPDGAVVRRNDLAAVPAVRDWLVHTADEPKCSDTSDPMVAEAVQNHVLTRLERLRAHPCIERRLEAGEPQLHGWYYEVHRGSVREHPAGPGTFEML